MNVSTTRLPPDGHEFIYICNQFNFLYAEEWLCNLLKYSCKTERKG